MAIKDIRMDTSMNIMTLVRGDIIIIIVLIISILRIVQTIMVVFANQM